MPSPDPARRLARTLLPRPVRSLRPNGSDAEVIADTYRANRAFHGWGHRFLYSRPFLTHVLTASGLTDIRFHDYGTSDDPNLRGLERQGTPEVLDGWPSVWNVEAVRPSVGGNGGAPRPEEALAAEVEQEFARFVRAGH